MAFSDLCQISNAFKTVENEADQSERIMEENSIVRDLIAKILDETGTADEICTPPDNSINSIPSCSSQYPKHEAANSFMSTSPYNNNLYNNYSQGDNGFNFNIPNGFNANGFVNYPENDANTLVGIDGLGDGPVTIEHLNLLRLAAQEIGGAQFGSPTKFDDKFYNFFEPNQRNSLPDSGMFTSSYSRPTSLNIDTNLNATFDAFNTQRYPNKYENGFMKEQPQEPVDLIAYINQFNLGNERARDEIALPSDFKMPMEMNSPYQNDEYNKMQEDRNKMFYNTRPYQQVPAKGFNGETNYYPNEILAQMSERNMGQAFDFTTPTTPNSMNFKLNGYQQPNDFMQRRDMNQIMPRDGFQGNNVDRANFDGMGRENAQAIMRQQDLARQMTLLMRGRPPPNQLNVDVSFLHENPQFNIGIGALIGPSPPHVPPPVMPSPMLDMPLLAPFYAMRNIRSAATSSGILHARLDACYEQWRQLERERKRTEARLALAYPGRAVSSSNSIPVPRLPPCPTRVDRLTVDMLREHTKVLTLMGKMETLRASVCVAQNKKPNRPEDGKITVLRRGQDNVPVEKEVDPATFDPSSWREDVKNLSEIAPHSEVESAMLAWRNAVASVQAARRRELAPQHAHTPHPAPHARYPRSDPILQLADAVQQLCESARRARCAMWCDLTLTVALAAPAANQYSPPLPKQSVSPKQSTSPKQMSPKQSPDCAAAASSGASKPHEQKENKAPTENQPSKPDAKSDDTKPVRAPERERSAPRRPQGYRRPQLYPRSRLDPRHAYHYLATGPIN